MTDLIHSYNNLGSQSDSLSHVDRLPKETGRNSVCTAEPALTSTALQERPMATIPDNAQSLFAQDCPTDPLIVQARFVNEAAQIERNLAMRKALRPARSSAATRGWETRRGL